MFQDRQRYENTRILNHIYSTLPMDEFLQGNFSQSTQIVDSYRNFIQICLEEGRKKQIGDHHETIRSYVQEQIAELLPQKDSLEMERQEIDKKLNDLKDILAEHFSAFQSESKAHGEWALKICNVFKAYQFNIYRFQNYFTELKEDQPTNYQKVEESYLWFRSQPLYETLESTQSAIDNQITKRRENTKKLFHKKNYMSIQSQLNRLESGITAHNIEQDVDKHVESIFYKKDMLGDVLDERDYRTIFTELIGSQMICNRTVSWQKKLQILQNHEDKIGLFGYLSDLATRLRIEEYHLGFEHSELTENHFEQKAEKYIELIKHIIDLSNKQIYFSIDPINDTDIDHMYQLLIGEKKVPYNMFEDATLHKVFERLYSYRESHDYQDLYERLRNYDLFHIHQDQREIVGLLASLYNYMTTEEKADVASENAGLHSFDMIEELANKGKPLNGILFDKATLDDMLPPPPEPTIPIKKSRKKKVVN